MEWNKEVNTNSGILMILIFSVLFILFDFCIIGAHIDGYPFNELSIGISNKTIEKNDSGNKDDSNESILSEEDALSIGKTLFDKMGGYYLGNGPKEIDSNGKIVGYLKNDDGSFYVTDNSDGLASYFKLDKEELRMIATEDYINDYVARDYIYYNGEYYMSNGDRGANISYYDTKLNIIRNSADTIIFDAVSSYFSDFSYHDGLVSAEDAPKETKTNTFRIVMEDGKWKISEFHKVY